MTSNESVFVPMFASKNSVEVHRDLEAFSFGSLVADCGGVLGLFVGFNFLIVWEWIIWFIEKLFLHLIQKVNFGINIKE